MKTNGMSIAALVLGIIGLVFSCLIFGAIPCVIALVLGIISLTNPGKRHGCCRINMFGGRIDVFNIYRLNYNV